MTLDQVKKGLEVRILSIRNAESRSRLAQMGIWEGRTVVCEEKLPFGPVVLRCKRQEIAVGRQLARDILVE